MWYKEAEGRILLVARNTPCLGKGDEGLLKYMSAEPTLLLKNPPRYPVLGRTGSGLLSTTRCLRTFLKGV